MPTHRGFVCDQLTGGNHLFGVLSHRGVWEDRVLQELSFAEIFWRRHYSGKMHELSLHRYQTGELEKGEQGTVRG